MKLKLTGGQPVSDEELVVDLPKSKKLFRRKPVKWNRLVLLAKEQVIYDVIGATKSPVDILRAIQEVAPGRNVEVLKISTFPVTLPRNAFHAATLGRKIGTPVSESGYLVVVRIGQKIYGNDFTEGKQKYEGKSRKIK